jgi:hypothetical protein
VRLPTRSAPLVLGLVVLTATAGACSGADKGGVTDVTLPSSLSITTTVPGAASTTTPVTDVPPTSPAADGAPVIRSLVAEPGAAACSGGTIPVRVTFETADQPPVRVFSVFLDGAPGGSSATIQPITVAGVACDGGVHTILFIATGTNGQSSTQAVAFRAPAAA